MTRTLVSLGLTALVIATLSCGPARAASASMHPFGGADWQQLARAAPRAIAPDGRTILVEETHGRARGADVHVWYTLATDGHGRRLLHLPKSFEPFGFAGSAHSLYGTIDVQDTPQLARWTIGTHATRIIARIANGISAIVPSNDGARYALLADPRPRDPLDATRTVVTNDESALFVVAAAGGKPVRWCARLDQIGGLAWAPDGTRIAVISQTPKIGYHRVSGRIDLCTSTSSRNIARITNAVLNEIPYPGAGIAWADGGRDLAFLSTTTDVITPDHLWTVPVAGGAPLDRTPNIPTSILALRGDPRGNVWTTIANGVQTEVGRYAEGVLQRAFVIPGGVVDVPVTTDLAAAPATLAFGCADPTHTTNVAVARGGAIVKLTHAGDETLAHVRLGRVIRHRWTSADGTPLEAIVLAGYDWGGRAACIVAALWPRRVRALVSGCGYNIQNIAAAARPQPPEAERRNWYQFYFHSQRGRDGLATYRNELARLLWRLWSPSWPFDEATFAASAASFANDDFVEIVVHSYRHRYGYAPGDAALAQIESQLAAQPAIGVPAIVLHGDEDGVDPPTTDDGHAAHFLGGYERRILPRVGHNIPQEAPEATAAAILAFHSVG